MKNVFLKLYARVYSTLKCEKGQAMVEYGLIIGLVAIVLIGGLILMRDPLMQLFTTITTKLNGAVEAANATQAPK